MKLIASAFGLLVLASLFMQPKNDGTASAPSAQAVGRHACGYAIKKQLRDPGSYQFVDLTLDPNDASTGIQTFRAKNGFGGYTAGQASCTRVGDNTSAVLLTSN
ncbi:MAG: hypothetical protein RL509_1358 [Pseudomonadota bacterium]|jgi:hypothetical protein